MYQELKPVRTASARALAAGLAELLRPPEAIDVAGWAARYRILSNPGGGYSGDWDNTIAPYLVEPMRALSDPLVKMVAVKGPSQAGKTDLGLNWLGWQIDVDPADCLVCQPTKGLAQTFSEERVDELLDLVKGNRLRDKQLADQGADNIFRKWFRGMSLFAIWPVGSEFTQRPVPRGWLDDYDQYDEDIDGQGTAVMLMTARQTTFEGREKSYVSSSPALGDGRGIDGLVKSGTNERLHWQCPHCQEYFVPETDQHLKFRRDGTADDAAVSAHVVCPTNGCIILPREKRALAATEIWLEPHQTIAADGTILGEKIGGSRRTFTFDGLFGFLSWGTLASEWFEAEQAFEARQDENPLKTFYQTRIGKNYRSRLAEAPRVTVEELKDRLELGWMLGTVPPGVVFLTGSVDVQKGRFVVSVWGWGAGGESWLVDRFEIFMLEDGSSSVDPASHLEHWRVLLPLFSRRWPLSGQAARDGAEASLPVLGWAIDTGGEPGVSDNAYKFWALATRLVSRERVTLVKGGNQPNGPLLPSTWLEQKRKGGPRKTGAQLFKPNVHVLKDVLDARLRREDPGAGYIHFPENLPETVLAELLAEEKRKGLWVKIAARNELIDLYVYAYTVVLRLAGQRVDLGWVPEWARSPGPSAPVPPVRRKDTKIGAAAKAEAAAPKPEAVQAAEQKFNATAFAGAGVPRRGRGVRSAGVRI
jgi:phage terminase large subunit GpA-like protein